MQIISEQKPIELPIVGRPSLPKQDLIGSTQPLTQKFMNAAPYPESAAQWLLNLLDLLTGIVDGNENLDRIVMTEAEYQQLLKALEDMMYGVGENEDHPLSAAMTLVGVLIKAYEDERFPKLIDLFPELAEEIQVELASESNNFESTVLGLTKTDFAAAIFSIGALLLQVGGGERTISAYNLVLHIKPDYAQVYMNRGRAKCARGDY